MVRSPNSIIQWSLLILNKIILPKNDLDKQTQNIKTNTYISSPFCTSVVTFASGGAFSADRRTMLRPWQIVKSPKARKTNAKVAVIFMSLAKFIVLHWGAYHSATIFILDYATTVICCCQNNIFKKVGDVVLSVCGMLFEIAARITLSKEFTDID